MAATNELTGPQIKRNNTCGWLCKQTVFMLTHCKHFIPYLHRPLSCIRIFVHGGKARPERIPMICTVPCSNPAPSPTSTLSSSVRIYKQSFFMFHHPYFLSSFYFFKFTVSTLYHMGITNCFLSCMGHQAAAFQAVL